MHACVHALDPPHTSKVVKTRKGASSVYDDVLGKGASALLELQRQQDNPARCIAAKEAWKKLIAGFSSQLPHGTSAHAEVVRSHVVIALLNEPDASAQTQTQTQTHPGWVGVEIDAMHTVGPLAKLVLRSTEFPPDKTNALVPTCTLDDGTVCGYTPFSTNSNSNLSSKDPHCMWSTAEPHRTATAFRQQCAKQGCVPAGDSSFDTCRVATRAPRDNAVLSSETLQRLALAVLAQFPTANHFDMAVALTGPAARFKTATTVLAAVAIVASLHSLKLITLPARATVDDVAYIFTYDTRGGYLHKPVKLANPKTTLLPNIFTLTATTFELAQFPHRNLDDIDDIDDLDLDLNLEIDLSQAPPDSMLQSDWPELPSDSHRITTRDIVDHIAHRLRTASPRVAIFDPSFETPARHSEPEQAFWLALCSYAHISPWSAKLLHEATAIQTLHTSEPHRHNLYSLLNGEATEVFTTPDFKDFVLAVLINARLMTTHTTKTTKTLPTAAQRDKIGAYFNTDPPEPLDLPNIDDLNFDQPHYHDGETIVCSVDGGTESTTTLLGRLLPLAKEVIIQSNTNENQHPNTDSPMWWAWVAEQTTRRLAAAPHGDQKPTPADNPVLVEPLQTAGPELRTPEAIQQYCTALYDHERTHTTICPYHAEQILHDAKTIFNTDHMILAAGDPSALLPASPQLHYAVRVQESGIPHTRPKLKLKSGSGPGHGVTIVKSPHAPTLDDVYVVFLQKDAHTCSPTDCPQTVPTTPYDTQFTISPSQLNSANIARSFAATPTTIKSADAAQNIVRHFVNELLLRILRPPEKDRNATTRKKPKVTNIIYQHPWYDTPSTQNDTTAESVPYIAAITHLPFLTTPDGSDPHTLPCHYPKETNSKAWWKQLQDPRNWHVHYKKFDRVAHRRSVHIALFHFVQALSPQPMHTLNATHTIAQCDLCALPNTQGSSVTSTSQFLKNLERSDVREGMLGNTQNTQNTQHLDPTLATAHLCSACYTLVACAATAWPTATDLSNLFTYAAQDPLGDETDLFFPELGGDVFPLPAEITLNPQNGLTLLMASTSAKNNKNTKTKVTSLLDIAPTEIAIIADRIHHRLTADPRIDLTITPGLHPGATSRDATPDCVNRTIAFLFQATQTRNAAHSLATTINARGGWQDRVKLALDLCALAPCDERSAHTTIVHAETDAYQTHLSAHTSSLRSDDGGTRTLNVTHYKLVRERPRRIRLRQLCLNELGGKTLAGLHTPDTVAVTLYVEHMTAPSGTGIIKRKELGAAAVCLQRVSPDDVELTLSLYPLVYVPIPVGCNELLELGGSNIKSPNFVDGEGVEWHLTDTTLVPGTAPPGTTTRHPFGMVQYSSYIHTPNGHYDVHVHDGSVLFTVPHSPRLMRYIQKHF